MDSQEHSGRPGAPTTSEATTRFESEISVAALGDGVYEATLHRSWWIIAGPNGGYVAAVILRAMVAEVDEAERRPRSLTVQYLRPPREGGVQISVTIERSGRSVSNVTARMTQDGNVIAIAMAAFAVERPSPVAFDETDGLADAFGDVPVVMADQVEPLDPDPDRNVPMRGHYDLRWVIGTLPFQADADTDPTARSGGWLRPAEPVAIDEVVLAAMADAWMPPIFSRMSVPLAVPTIDLTIHFRDLPTDPYGFCFVIFESPVAAHGYTVEHGRILSPTGRLLAESRQLAVLA